MVTIALLAFKSSVLKLSYMRMMLPFTEDCPSSKKKGWAWVVLYTKIKWHVHLLQECHWHPISPLPAHWIHKYHVQKPSLTALNDML